MDIVTTTVNDIPMDELADRLKSLSLDGQITGFYTLTMTVLPMR